MRWVTVLLIVATLGVTAVIHAQDYSTFTDAVGNNWLALKFSDAAANRGVVGAQVTVVGSDGALQQLGPMTHNQRHELRYAVNPVMLIDVGSAAGGMAEAPTATIDSGGGGRRLQTILQWSVVAAAFVLAYVSYLYWQARSAQ
ncbi:MAG: hypothetical protein GY803_19460 [Chloroflexi bacterium]|nr:hypothetical protein [Chloroflexota bacterium]